MPSVGFSCPSVQLSLVEASPETRLALLPLEGGGDGDNQPLRWQQSSENKRQS